MVGSKGMTVLKSSNIGKKLDSLPASSPAVTKLLSIIDDPKTTRDDILKLVTLDQVLFANAFKYANSAAVGSFRKLESLTEIIDILGFGILKNIAVLTALRSVTVDKKLWFEGVFLAIAAKTIAKKLNKDKHYCDEIFIAGLMQSYGVFVLSHFYPDSYAEFRAMTNYQERIAKEREVFEMSHLDISAAVLLDWGLPQKVTEIIANQASYKGKATEEQNTIIELARFLLGMESKGDEEIKYLLKSNQELQSNLTKQKITLYIDQEFINKLFDETKGLVNI